MKIFEILQQDGELLVEQQLIERILAPDSQQEFEAPITAEELLEQLGIANV